MIKQGEIQATIRGDIVEVEYVRNNAICSKMMSSIDFAKAVSCATPDTAYMNFMNFGTRFVGRKDNVVFVGIEFPEHVGMYSFSGKDTFDTVYPNALIIVRASVMTNGNYVYSGIEAFALKGIITGSESQLFDWPGSNVHPSGSVCMGHFHNNKEMESIKKVGDIAHAFFLTPNNNDMSTNRFRAMEKITHPYDLFYSLKVSKNEEPKKFPYECLNFNTTLGAYIASKGLSIND